MNAFKWLFLIGLALLKYVHFGEASTTNPITSEFYTNIWSWISSNYTIAGWIATGIVLMTCIACLCVCWICTCGGCLVINCGSWSCFGIVRAGKKKKKKDIETGEKPLSIVPEEELALLDPESCMSLGTEKDVHSISSMENVREKLETLMELNDKMQHLEKIGNYPIALPKGSLNLIMIDISDSQDLWKKNSKAMLQSVTMMNHVIRKELDKFGGQEIEKFQDSHVVGFDNCWNAVSFVIRLRNEFLRIPWPEKMLQMEEASIVKESGKHLFRGPRVNISIDFCPLKTREEGKEVAEEKKVPYQEALQKQEETTEKEVVVENEQDKQTDGIEEKEGKGTDAEDAKNETENNKHIDEANIKDEVVKPAKIQKETTKEAEEERERLSKQIIENLDTISSRCHYGDTICTSRFWKELEKSENELKEKHTLPQKEEVECMILPHQFGESEHHDQLEQLYRIIPEGFEGSTKYISEQISKQTPSKKPSIFTDIKKQKEQLLSLVKEIQKLLFDEVVLASEPIKDEEEQPLLAIQSPRERLLMRSRSLPPMVDRNAASSEGQDIDPDTDIEGLTDLTLTEISEGKGNEPDDAPLSPMAKPSKEMESSIPDSERDPTIRANSSKPIPEGSAPEPENEEPWEEPEPLEPEEALNQLNDKMEFFTPLQQEKEAEEGITGEPKALLCVEIDSFDKIWDHCYRQKEMESFKSLVREYYQILRILLKQHKGKELQVQDHRFFCSFESPESALRYGAELQTTVLKISYPNILFKLPFCRRVVLDGKMIFSGFRCKMCLHWAKSEDFKLLSEKYEGQAMNAVQSLLLWCPGGQIIGSPDTWKMLEEVQLGEDIKLFISPPHPELEFQTAVHISLKARLDHETELVQQEPSMPWKTSEKSLQMKLHSQTKAAPEEVEAQPEHPEENSISSVPEDGVVIAPMAKKDESVGVEEHPVEESVSIQSTPQPEEIQPITLDDIQVVEQPEVPSPKRETQRTFGMQTDPVEEPPLELSGISAAPEVINGEAQNQVNSLLKQIETLTEGQKDLQNQLSSTQAELMRSMKEKESILKNARASDMGAAAQDQPNSSSTQEELMQSIQALMQGQQYLQQQLTATQVNWDQNMRDKEEVMRQKEAILELKASLQADENAPKVDDLLKQIDNLVHERRKAAGQEFDDPQVKHMLEKINKLLEGQQNLEEHLNETQEELYFSMKEKEEQMIQTEVLLDLKNLLNHQKGTQAEHLSKKIEALMLGQQYINEQLSRVPPPEPIDGTDQEKALHELKRSFSQVHHPQLETLIQHIDVLMQGQKALHAQLEETQDELYQSMNEKEEIQLQTELLLELKQGLIDNRQDLHTTQFMEGFDKWIDGQDALKKKLGERLEGKPERLKSILEQIDKIAEAQQELKEQLSMAKRVGEGLTKKTIQQLKNSLAEDNVPQFQNVIMHVEQLMEGQQVLQQQLTSSHVELANILKQKEELQNEKQKMIVLRESVGKEENKGTDILIHQMDLLVKGQKMLQDQLETSKVGLEEALKEKERLIQQKDVLIQLQETVNKEDSQSGDVTALSAHVQQLIKGQEAIQNQLAQSQSDLYETLKEKENLLTQKEAMIELKEKSQEDSPQMDNLLSQITNLMKGQKELQQQVSVSQEDLYQNIIEKKELIKHKEILLEMKEQLNPNKTNPQVEELVKQVDQLIRGQQSLQEHVTESGDRLAEIMKEKEELIEQKEKMLQLQKELTQENQDPDQLASRIEELVNGQALLKEQLLKSQANLQREMKEKKQLLEQKEVMLQIKERMSEQENPQVDNLVQQVNNLIAGQKTIQEELSQTKTDLTTALKEKADLMKQKELLLEIKESLGTKKENAQVTLLLEQIASLMQGQKSIQEQLQSSHLGSIHDLMGQKDLLLELRQLIHDQNNTQAHGLIKHLENLLDGQQTIQEKISFASRLELTQMTEGEDQEHALLKQQLKHEQDVVEQQKVALSHQEEMLTDLKTSLINAMTDLKDVQSNNPQIKIVLQQIDQLVEGQQTLQSQLTESQQNLSSNISQSFSEEELLLKQQEESFLKQQNALQKQQDMLRELKENLEEAMIDLKESFKQHHDSEIMDQIDNLMQGQKSIQEQLTTSLLDISEIRNDDQSFTKQQEQFESNQESLQDLKATFTKAISEFTEVQKKKDPLLSQILEQIESLTTGQKGLEEKLNQSLQLTISNVSSANDDEALAKQKAVIVAQQQALFELKQTINDALVEQSQKTQIEEVVEQINALMKGQTAIQEQLKSSQVEFSKTLTDDRADRQQLIQQKEMLKELKQSILESLDGLKKNQDDETPIAGLIEQIENLMKGQTAIKDQLKHSQLELTGSLQDSDMKKQQEAIQKQQEMQKEMLKELKQSIIESLDGLKDTKNPQIAGLVEQIDNLMKGQTEIQEQLKKGSNLESSFVSDEKLIQHQEEVLQKQQEMLKELKQSIIDSLSHLNQEETPQIKKLADQIENLIQGQNVIQQQLESSHLETTEITNKDTKLLEKQQETLEQQQNMLKEWRESVTKSFADLQQNNPLLKNVLGQIDQFIQDQEKFQMNLANQTLRDKKEIQEEQQSALGLLKEGLEEAIQDLKQNMEKDEPKLEALMNDITELMKGQKSIQEQITLGQLNDTQSAKSDQQALAKQKEVLLELKKNIDAEKNEYLDNVMKKIELLIQGQEDLQKQVSKPSLEETISKSGAMKKHQEGLAQLQEGISNAMDEMKQSLLEEKNPQVEHVLKTLMEGQQQLQNQLTQSQSDINRSIKDKEVLRWQEKALQNLQNGLKEAVSELKDTIHQEKPSSQLQNLLELVDGLMKGQKELQNKVATSQADFNQSLIEKEEIQRELEKEAVKKQHEQLQDLKESIATSMNKLKEGLIEEQNPQVESIIQQMDRLMKGQDMLQDQLSQSQAHLTQSIKEKTSVMRQKEALQDLKESITKAMADLKKSVIEEHNPQFEKLLHTLTHGQESIQKQLASQADFNETLNKQNLDKEEMLQEEALLKQEEGLGELKHSVKKQISDLKDSLLKEENPQVNNVLQTLMKGQEEIQKQLSTSQADLSSSINDKSILFKQNEKLQEGINEAMIQLKKSLMNEKNPQVEDVMETLLEGQKAIQLQLNSSQAHLSESIQDKSELLKQRETLDGLKESITVSMIQLKSELIKEQAPQVENLIKQMNGLMETQKNLQEQLNNAQDQMNMSHVDLSETLQAKEDFMKEREAYLDLKEKLSKEKDPKVIKMVEQIEDLMKGQKTLQEGIFNSQTELAQNMIEKEELLKRKEDLLSLQEQMKKEKDPKIEKLLQQVETLMQSQAQLQSRLDESKNTLSETLLQKQDLEKQKEILILEKEQIHKEKDPQIQNLLSQIDVLVQGQNTLNSQLSDAQEEIYQNIKEKDELLMQTEMLLELKEAMENTDEKEVQVTKLMSQIENLVDGQKDLQNKLEVSQADLMQSMKDKQELLKQKEELQEKFRLEKDPQINKLLGQIDTLMDGQNALQEQLSTTQDNLYQSIKEKEELLVHTEMLIELKESVNENKPRVETVLQQIDNLKVGQQALKEQLSSSQADLSQSMKEKNPHVDQLIKQVDGLMEAQKNLQQELSQSQNDLLQSMKEKEDLLVKQEETVGNLNKEHKEEAKELQDQIEDLEYRIDEMTKEKQTLEQEADDFEEEIKKLNMRVQSLIAAQPQTRELGIQAQMKGSSQGTQTLHRGEGRHAQTWTLKEILQEHRGRLRNLEKRLEYFSTQQSFSLKQEGPRGKVAFVNLSMEKPYRMWELNYDQMLKSYQTYATLTEDLIKQLHGYIVKTDKEQVMLVFKTCQDALSFILQFLEDVKVIEWPCPRWSRQNFWRAAIHCGEPMVQTGSERHEYFGPVVKRTEVLLRKTRGGEILLTDDVVVKLGTQFFKDKNIRDLGIYDLGPQLMEEHVFNIGDDYYPLLQDRGLSDQQYMKYLTEEIESLEKDQPEFTQEQTEKIITEKLTETLTKTIESKQAAHIEGLLSGHIDEMQMEKKQHQEEVERLNQQHEDEMKEIRQVHKDTIDQLQQEQKIVMAQLDQQFSKLTQHHKEEMDHMTQEYQDQLDETTESHQEEVEAMMKDHSKQVEALKQEYSTEIERIQKKLNQVVHDEELTSTQKNTLQLKYEELRLQVDDQEDEIAKHEAQVAKQNLIHGQEVKRLELQIKLKDGEIQQLQKSLESENSSNSDFYTSLIGKTQELKEKIHDLETELDKIKEEKRSLEEELADKKLAHKQAMQQTESGHADAMDDLSKKHAAQLEKMQNENDEILEKLEADHAAALKELKMKHEEEVSKMQADHEQYLEDNSVGLDQDAAAFKQLLDKERRAGKELKQHVLDLEESEKLTRQKSKRDIDRLQKEKKDIKQQMAKLKLDHQLLQEKKLKEEIEQEQKNRTLQDEIKELEEKMAVESESSDQKHNEELERLQTELKEATEKLKEADEKQKETAEQNDKLKAEKDIQQELLDTQNRKLAEKEKSYKEQLDTLMQSQQKAVEGIIKNQQEELLKNQRKLFEQFRVDSPSSPSAQQKKETLVKPSPFLFNKFARKKEPKPIKLVEQPQRPVPEIMSAQELQEQSTKPEPPRVVDVLWNVFLVHLSDLEAPYDPLNDRPSWNYQYLSKHGRLIYADEEFPYVKEYNVKTVPFRQVAHQYLINEQSQSVSIQYPLLAQGLAFFLPGMMKFAEERSQSTQVNTSVREWWNCVKEQGTHWIQMLKSERVKILNTLYYPKSNLQNSSVLHVLKLKNWIDILSYLTNQDLYVLSCTCRSMRQQLRPALDCCCVAVLDKFDAHVLEMDIDSDTGDNQSTMSAEEARQQWLSYEYHENKQ